MVTKKAGNEPQHAFSWRQWLGMNVSEQKQQRDAETGSNAPSSGTGWEWFAPTDEDSARSSIESRGESMQATSETGGEEEEVRYEGNPENEILAKSLQEKHKEIKDLLNLLEYNPIFKTFKYDQEEVDALDLLLYGSYECDAKDWKSAACFFEACKKLMECPSDSKLPKQPEIRHPKKKAVR